MLIRSVLVAVPVLVLFVLLLDCLLMGVNQLLLMFDRHLQLLAVVLLLVQLVVFAAHLIMLNLNLLVQIVE
jgi:hypothetical protein